MKNSLIITIVVALAAALAVGASAAGHTTTVATANSSLGRILVDARGRTLYLFEKDTRVRSACAGTCATYWPPLLTRVKPTVGRGARKSFLGTIRRRDGSTQVTYAGHPLYRFLLDARPGQTLGQDSHDFGAGWYVVSPAGSKIEADQAGASGSAAAAPLLGPR